MIDSGINIQSIKRILTKKQVKSLDLDDAKSYFEQINEPRYRADQLFNEIYFNKAKSFSEMTTLPVNLRNSLKEQFELTSISIDSKRISKDGSIKYLFTLNDSKSIEAVYMPWTNDEGNVERSTLCISSMAGCPVGCAFCATGTLGFKRNLSPAEMIDQIFLVEEDLNLKINNIVIMGMGEPLLNYENVVKFLHIATDEKSKILSRRKITLSTSGIAPRIKQLAHIVAPPKLAISLHATTNGLRQQIMPISKSFNLSVLMDSVEYYYRQTKLPITYEYILFDGLNDTDEDIERLRKIALRVPSRLNFIPYNDISFANPQGITNELKPTPHERIVEFADALRNSGVAVIVRDTYGRDIEAACGQLALAKEKESIEK